MSSIFDNAMRKVASGKQQYGKGTLTKYVANKSKDVPYTEKGEQPMGGVTKTVLARKIAERNSGSTGVRGDKLSTLDKLLAGQAIMNPIIDDRHGFIAPGMTAAGTAIGGTAGYMLDKKNPTRGAILGSIGGGVSSYGLYRILKHLGAIA
jgi:hypothetical protein